MRLTRRQLLATTAAALTAPSAAEAFKPVWHLPAEDAPHIRTFMQWPVSRLVHPDPVFLQTLQQTIARIANTIADFEDVVMLMHPLHEATARRQLSRRVEIWHVPTEDLWCRDSGPVFVNRTGSSRPQKQAVVSFNFNGWGNKQVHRDDGQVAERVAAQLGLDLIDSGLTGELGGVEWDGANTLIAHESSWVNPNRNNLSRREITERLTAVLGHARLIWAPGLAGHDITDYHIDSLARFAGPDEILIQMPDKPDRDDPFDTAALRTHEILQDAFSDRADRLRITVIPSPRTTRVQSDDFVASYANFYVCNGAVISARFGDPETDTIAQTTLARHYPGREIVTLNVDALGEVGGGIHCATQQQPVVD